MSHFENFFEIQKLENLKFLELLYIDFFIFEQQIVGIHASYSYRIESGAVPMKHEMISKANKSSENVTKKRVILSSKKGRLSLSQITVFKLRSTGSILSLIFHDSGGNTTSVNEERVK